MTLLKTTLIILMISETKLDSSFPNGQFPVHGYSESNKFEKNGNSKRILVFIREDITTKLIECQMKIEGVFIELNLKRKRWLLCNSYYPKCSQISHHFKEIGKYLDVLISKYDNIILIIL